ncbi:MAG: hypothetical protein IJ880_06045 [Bacilli bacterium]|nr:hypothetical protein [Bacilli bacterium]
MQKTTHYELNLPDGDDYYDVNDFNGNASAIDNLIFEVNQEITEMKATFQAGVEACYNACVTKGSTPASYALRDVVQGILNISSGGGDAYSMFPQEILGENLYPTGCYQLTDYLPLTDSDNLVIAHIIPTGDTNITVLFNGDIETSYAGTITFSLVIDNTTTIPNIGTITIGHLDYGERQSFSMSYTLTNSLSSGYHTLALRATFGSGLYGGQIYWALCSFYGTGFIAVQNPGYYLINGAISSYYTPSNFVTPTNPTTYQLYCYYDQGGCAVIEDIEEAMNNHYSDTFDSGVSYHIEAIDGYWVETENPETGETDYEYIVPDISDTLTYTNGKFVYDHSVTRTFPDGSGVGVKEQHYFILPINPLFLGLYDYVNIHGKLAYKDDTIDYTTLKIVFFERVDEDEIEFNNNYNDMSFSSLDENDEFILSFDMSDFNNNSINFIGIYFSNMDSSDDPYTVEIDKIWGSNIDPTN